MANDKSLAEITLQVPSGTLVVGQTMGDSLCTPLSMDFTFQLFSEMRDGKRHLALYGDIAPEHKAAVTSSGEVQYSPQKKILSEILLQNIAHRLSRQEPPVTAQYHPHRHESIVIGPCRSGDENRLKEAVIQAAHDEQFGFECVGGHQLFAQRHACASLKVARAVIDVLKQYDVADRGEIESPQARNRMAASLFQALEPFVDHRRPGEHYARAVEKALGEFSYERRVRTGYSWRLGDARPSLQGELHQAIDKALGISPPDPAVRR